RRPRGGAVGVRRRAGGGAPRGGAPGSGAPGGPPAAGPGPGPVTRESNGIPPHLSLPSSRSPWLSVVASRNEPAPEIRGETTMTKHKTGTRKEWLAARLELLPPEKQLTPRRHELPRPPPHLPRVPIA